MMLFLRIFGTSGRPPDRASRYAVCVALLLVTMPVAGAAQQPAASVPLRPGDIVVIGEPQKEFGLAALLIKVDPSTGLQTILSDFGDPAQGPIGGILGDSPRPALVIEDATDIFVWHPYTGTEVNGIPRGALMRVDPTTGVRTIISDLGDPSQGPVAGGPNSSGVAIEASGDFLIVSPPGLVRVNRLTGMRTIVSVFSDFTQGFQPNPTYGAIAIEKSGRIVVEDAAEANSPYGLVRVEPSTGARTLFSNFANTSQGPGGVVTALTIDHSGNILVGVSGLICGGCLPPYRGILRVDPVTGMRTPLSEFLEDEVCRVPFANTFAQALAVAETGEIVVTPSNDPSTRLQDELFRVDPNTAVCTLLSATGWTRAVAVVPTPIMNRMVSLSVTNTVLEPSAGEPFAPAGVFKITAAFTNETSLPIRNPFFRVAELSGGNMLVSGDRPPDLIRRGGKGTRQTADAGIDSVLSPGESVTVEFGVGLQTRHPFTFLIDVFGEPDAPENSQ
jgi:hypothetical protein